MQGSKLFRVSAQVGGEVENRPRRPERAARFVLYVEGPRDCDLLRTFARHLSPALARAVGASAVILGGRRPARAQEHFRDLGGASAGVRALCVLDRDDEVHAPPPRDACRDGT